MCTLGLVDALNNAPALLPTEPTQGRNYKSVKCGRDSATICFSNLFETKPRNSVAKASTLSTEGTLETTQENPGNHVEEAFSKSSL